MTAIYIIDNTGEIQLAAANKLSVAEMCENEIQALNRLETGLPAIVLLHYAVREAGTTEFVRILRQVNSAAEIIILGDNLQDELIIQCILAGAKGYQNIITFENCVEKLITVVAAGEAWISRKMVAGLIDYWRQI